MTIGIICAIPEEFDHLERVMDSTAVQRIGAVDYYAGTLDGQAVVLARAGIGKVNAAMTATIMAHSHACRLIILSGVAGGLDPDLRIGDVVIADKTIQHDAGVWQQGQIHTSQAGHVPFFNPVDRLGYGVSGELVETIRPVLEALALPALSAQAGGHGGAPRIVFGTILTGDQFLNCEATRQRLFSEFGGRAIEMEGGAIGQVCEAFGIPYLDIRALSDLAGTEARLDFPTFVHEVAASSVTILRAILRVV